MRTVVLVAPELYPVPPIRGGAAELFIDQVAGRLSRWRPLVICPADPRLARQEVRGQVEYHRLPLMGWRKRLYQRYRHFFHLYDWMVAHLIQKVQPALVHVHNRPLLALYLRQHLSPQVPIILHMHNLYDSLGKRERPQPGTSMPVDCLVACSQFVLEREKDRLGRGAGRHRVVYNGVDTSAFLSLWDHGDRVAAGRQPYRLTDEPTVLFAGKLRESKGVHILLAAMKRVWQEVPRAVLALVGGTEYGRGRTGRKTRFFKELTGQIAGAAGRVVLTGFVPPERMPLTYLLGDLFVGPSQIEEGLGLVFLEAGAAGLPVIASAVGGIPEIVRPGETGLLLQRKDDAGELAEKIILLLKDEDRRKKLGQQARQWVTTHFSWEKIAQSLEEVYEEVLEGEG